MGVTSNYIMINEPTIVNLRLDLDVLVLELNETLNTFVGISGC